MRGAFGYYLTRYVSVAILAQAFNQVFDGSRKLYLLDKCGCDAVNRMLCASTARNVNAFRERQAADMDTVYAASGCHQVVSEAKDGWTSQTPKADRAVSTCGLDSGIRYHSTGDCFATSLTNPHRILNGYVCIYGSGTTSRRTTGPSM